MPIECTVCKERSRVVHFRSYSHYPAQVRTLWWLVLASAVISTYNAGKLFFDLVPLLEASDQLREDVSGLEGTGQLGLLVGDATQFFANVVNYLFLITMVALFYLPIRYGIILKRFRRGAPTTYWNIRGTAKLTVGLALFIAFTLVYLFSGLVSFYIGPSLGLNVLVAPLILFQMRRREVGEYFSQFTWEALPPVEPVAPTFLPEGPAKGKEWERVD